MVDCPDIPVLIESKIDRVLTQYRESPNLSHVMRTYLAKVGEVVTAACSIPTFFDLDTAVGDQLTLLGKRLGFPRCHCVCTVQPVFGFACEGVQSRYPIVGFCDSTSTWLACGVFGESDICLDDDATYRAFLQVRRYQMLGLYDLESLTEAIRIFWGPTATVMDAGKLRVVVAPGRPLSIGEEALLQLYGRVLPLAPGIELRYHFGEIRVFGFGEGWGGFAEESLDMTQATKAYSRTEKVFGFCEDDADMIGGFCEVWDAEGLPIGGDGNNGNMFVLVDSFGNEISTGPLKANSAWMCRKDAPWMCEIDARPYSC